MSNTSVRNFNSRSDGLRSDFPRNKLKYRSYTSLPESFECLFDPQRSFGNLLRALFLETRDFFCTAKFSFLAGTSRMKKIEAESDTT